MSAHYLNNITKKKFVKTQLNIQVNKVFTEWKDDYFFIWYLTFVFIFGNPVLQQDSFISPHQESCTCWGEYIQ